jgi:hypothetical protein
LPKEWYCSNGFATLDMLAISYMNTVMVLNQQTSIYVSVWKMEKRSNNLMQLYKEVYSITILLRIYVQQLKVKGMIKEQLWVTRACI